MYEHFKHMEMKNKFEVYINFAVQESQMQLKFGNVAIITVLNITKFKLLVIFKKSRFFTQRQDIIHLRSGKTSRATWEISAY